MARNEDNDGAVENTENTFLVFAVSSDVCGALPWRFNISGQSLFPGGECLAQVDEQLAQHQVLATPAPTQAPGDKGNLPCFGQFVTFTCCCTWSPAPCAPDLQRAGFLFSPPKRPQEDWFYLGYPLNIPCLKDTSMGVAPPATTAAPRFAPLVQTVGSKCH